MVLFRFVRLTAFALLIVAQFVDSATVDYRIPANQKPNSFQETRLVEKPGNVAQHGNFMSPPVYSPIVYQQQQQPNYYLSNNQPNYYTYPVPNEKHDYVRYDASNIPLQHGQFQDKGEDKQDETALTADRTVAEIFTFSTLQRLLVPFVVRPVVGRFLVRPIIRHLLMPAGRFMWRAMFPLGVREFPGLKRIPTQLYPFAKWGANWAAEYVVFAVLRRTAESLIGLVTTTLL